MLLKNKTIFIVEDEPFNRIIITNILEREGATIHFDRHGTQTPDEIRAVGKVDLILMDLMLPSGKSGYDIFEELQMDQELRDIPVLIVSASDPALEIRKAAQMGFMGFISKPVNRKTLAPLLVAVLEGQKIWSDEFVP